MDNIKLVFPTKDYESQVKEYLQEHYTNGERRLNGVSELYEYDNYDEWLNKIVKEHKGIDTPSGRVPASIYFAVKESDNRIVGMINIRHSLNDYLLNYGGHIGYGVRPSERRKGYATRMLALALEKCRELGIDKVLVTCDKTNIGSARTIEKNNGVLENESVNTDGAPILRYWIDVN